MRTMIAAIAAVAAMAALAGCGGGGGAARFEGDWVGIFDGPGTDDGSFVLRFDRNGFADGFDNVHSEDCDAVGDMEARIDGNGFVRYFMDFQGSQACVPYTMDGDGDLDQTSGGWEGNTFAQINSANGQTSDTYFFYMERDGFNRSIDIKDLKARAKEMRAKIQRSGPPAGPNRQKVFK